MATTNEKGFHIAWEQIEKLGEEAPGRIDSYRAEQLAGLDRVTRSRLVQSRRERARLEFKHGSGAQAVLEADRRMAGQHRLLVAARMERARTVAPRPQRLAGAWILHGHVRNRDGLAAAGAVVALYPDAEGRQEALVETRSDSSGYYRLQYSRPQWEKLVAAASGGAATTGEEAGGTVLHSNAAAGEEEGTTRHRPEAEGGGHRLAAGLRINTRVRELFAREPVHVGARPDGGSVTMAAAPLYPAPSMITYRDLVLEQTGLGGAACALRTRHLGNSGTRELHDLEHESSGCRIEQIRPDHRVYFRNEKEAAALGYDYCAYCYGKARSKR